MDTKTKEISISDLLMRKISLFPLIYCIAILTPQFFIIILYKLRYLSVINQGYLFSYSIQGVLLHAIFGFIAHLFVNRKPLTDYTYGIKEAFLEFSTKYPAYDNRTMTRWKLVWLSLVDLIYFYNIILLLPLIYFLVAKNSFFKSVFAYLYGENIVGLSDPRLLVFIFLQFIQVCILFYIHYKKIEGPFNRGFKEIVEKKYNSEEAQRYPHYSRFWLYAVPITVFILWIFIHPLSLILIKLIH